MSRRQTRDSNDLASREDPYNVATASRIYFWPNLMTAGNLFCGFMAIISCIHAKLAESVSEQAYLGAAPPSHYRNAVLFILGAALFDTLDGRLARFGGRESLFGAEFDSIADVVSFGLAPALLMFFLILAPTQTFPWFRNIGWAVGFIYLLCAAMRLARFNVITNPLLNRSSNASKDFVGLPVPAAAATVASLVLTLLKLSDADKSLNKFALAIPPLMVLVALLMMSTIRYPSGKKVDLQTQTKFRTLAFVVVLLGLIFAFKEFAFLATCFGYIFFGLFRHWRRNRLIKKGVLPKPSNSP